MSLANINDILEKSQESLTSFTGVIDSDHAYIHDEIGFQVIANSGSVAAAALYKFSLETPSVASGKVIHMRVPSFSATANIMKLAVYEDSDSTGGTLGNIENKYRGRENSTIMSQSTFTAGVTAALTGRLLMASTAGGNFANQPAGDGIEFLSDSTADITQTVTLYGTITGALTTVTSETLTLTGTTAVSSAVTTWETLLGVELSAACAGTITIREASANAAITTIAAASLSAGVATITDVNARDRILQHDADGASTKKVGAIGTYMVDNVSTVISAVDNLNGATGENHGTQIFRTVTKLLIGDVASTTECWFLRPEIVIEEITAGSGGGPQSRAGGGGNTTDELVLEPATTYVLAIENIGTSAASIAYLKLFWYEEDAK